MAWQKGPSGNANGLYKNTDYRCGRQILRAPREVGHDADRAVQSGNCGTGNVGRGMCSAWPADRSDAEILERINFIVSGNS